MSPFQLQLFCVALGALNGLFMRPQICALSSDLSFEVFFTLLRHAAGPAYGCSYDSQRVLTCRAAWDPDAYMPMPNHKSPRVPDNLQRLISSLQHEKQSSGNFRTRHVPQSHRIDVPMWPMASIIETDING